MAVSGCAGWWRHEPPAKSVRIVTAEEVGDCTHVGSTHVSVIDKRLQLEQTEGAVKAELLRLAGQSAEQMGGNAVIEMTNMDDGSQSFALFRCPPSP